MIFFISKNVVSWFSGQFFSFRFHFSLKIFLFFIASVKNIINNVFELPKYSKLSQNRENNLFAEILPERQKRQSEKRNFEKTREWIQI